MLERVPVLEQAQLSVQERVLVLVQAQPSGLARVLVQAQAPEPRQHRLPHRPPQSLFQQEPFRQLAHGFRSTFLQWAMELRCPLCR